MIIHSIVGSGGSFMGWWLIVIGCKVLDGGWLIGGCWG